MRLPRFVSLRFSVRTLLVAIAILSIWLGREVRYYDRRIAAGAHFDRKYDWKMDQPGGVRWDCNFEIRGPGWTPTSPPQPVSWIDWRIGIAVVEARGHWPQGFEPAFKRVYRIEFGGREFNDDDFRQLTAFPEIESLDLVGTSVSDAIAPLFRSFPNLKTLKLGRYCDFAGSPEPVAIWLEIDGPGITGESMKYLCALSKLESLEIGGAHITDAGVRELVKLPNLKLLSLGATDVTTACVDDIIRMPKLEIFAVNGHVYPPGDKRGRPGLKIHTGD